MLTNIWFVDDDEDDFDFFKYALHQIIPGASVTHFRDANLKSFMQSGLPDIIFLDVSLPSIDGLECLKKLRNEKKFASVPIIIYSASFQKADEACKYGANYYIVKPESFPQIKEVLQFILSQNWKDAPLKFDVSN